MLSHLRTKKFASLIAALLLTVAATVPAAARSNDPGNPGDRNNLPCTFEGVLYTHGSTRMTVSYLGPNVIDYHYYKCDNTKWVFLYSWSDLNSVNVP